MPDALDAGAVVGALRDGWGLDVGVADYAASAEAVTTGEVTSGGARGS